MFSGAQPDRPRKTTFPSLISSSPDLREVQEAMDLLWEKAGTRAPCSAVDDKVDGFEEAAKAADTADRGLLPRRVFVNLASAVWAGDSLSTQVATACATLFTYGTGRTAGVSYRPFLQLLDVVSAGMQLDRVHGLLSIMITHIDGLAADVHAVAIEASVPGYGRRPASSSSAAVRKGTARWTNSVTLQWERPSSAAALPVPILQPRVVGSGGGRQAEARTGRRQTTSVGSPPVSTVGTAKVGLLPFLLDSSNKDIIIHDGSGREVGKVHAVLRFKHSANSGVADTLARKGTSGDMSNPPDLVRLREALRQRLRSSSSRPGLLHMLRFLRTVFDEFDCDGSGELDEEEFGAAMHKLPGIRMSAQAVAALFEYFDVSGDGTIDGDEFVFAVACDSASAYVRAHRGRQRSSLTLASPPRCSRAALKAVRNAIRDLAQSSKTFNGAFLAMKDSMGSLAAKVQPSSLHGKLESAGLADLSCAVGATMCALPVRISPRPPLRRAGAGGGRGAAA